MHILEYKTWTIKEVLEECLTGCISSFWYYTAFANPKENEKELAESWRTTLIDIRHLVYQDNYNEAYTQLQTLINEVKVVQKISTGHLYTITDSQLNNLWAILGKLKQNLDW